MLKFVCLIAFLAGAFAAPSFNGKIVGGGPAPLGAYPFIVSLRVKNNHFCGGSIISPNVVLTAAHCVHGMTTADMTAVVGTNYLNQGGISYPVSRLLYHGEYNPQAFTNDIGIVVLGAPIQYNPSVQPIALSTASPNPGDILTLIGWGLTSFPGNPSNELKHIALTTQDTGSCAAAWAGSLPITANQICTRGGPTGSCKGDSGGPLIKGNVLAGLVSFGQPCALGKPDVFTNVASYIGWIKSVAGI